jgi:hypothetical protein
MLQISIYANYANIKLDSFSLVTQKDRIFNKVDISYPTNGTFNIYGGIVSDT